jgi:hypothetical protein
MNSHPRLPEFIGRLRGVKQTPSGYTACCPVHGDEHPSLSIAIGNNGGILVHCHAQQCKAEDIAQAVMMTINDFMPPNDLPKQPAKGSTKADGKKAEDESFESRIEATYDYCDEAGKLLFQCVRLRDPKDFRQRVKCGAGVGKDGQTIEPRWRWKLGDVRRVPYHYPEIIAAPPEAWIFVVEGEKDCDNLRELGLHATSSPQGAGKWDKIDPAALEKAFKGRNVFILRDQDSAGVRHQIRVADSLAKIAAKIKIVRLPGQGDGQFKDVTNWLESDQ